MRRLESPRRLFVVWFVVTLLLALTACLGGCAAHAQGSDSGCVLAWIVAVSLATAGIVALIVEGYGWAVTILMVCAAAMTFAGCAALPMPLQPQTDNNSNMAEGTFIVLAAVDTVQTMHIRKGTSCDHEADPIAAALYGSTNPKPARVLFTNLALITVHTMLASWLDDKVEEHKADDAAGLWYVGRIGFHAVSIVAEGSSVINNHVRGCRP